MSANNNVQINYIITTLLDLNDFMWRLDARYAKKVSTEGGTVARKVRKSGEASKSLPPSDAPDWTVDPSKLQKI